MSIRPSLTCCLAGALALAVGGLVIAQFVRPAKDGAPGAIESLDDLSPALRRAFSDEGEFSAKRPPQPGDWLAQHEEPGQSFASYLRSEPNLPSAERKTIYILPIGEFADERAPSLVTLRQYAAAYFHPLAVWTLPPVDEEAVRAASRINDATKQRQWNSRDLLEWMQGRLPGDAYAMLAVTMTDLYPEESWNYVFGQASLVHRVGVFSFARYDPRFWGEAIDEGSERLMLQRAAKVLTHETGHMFGIAHCIDFECIMNGSNNLRETDATRMHLCPVCLRKLHHASGFDPVARYRKLRAFYGKSGMDDEAGWVERRIGAIEGAR